MRCLKSSHSLVSSSRMGPANSFFSSFRLICLGMMWSIVSWENFWWMVSVILLAHVLSTGQLWVCSISASSCVMKHGWKMLGSLYDAMIFWVSLGCASLVHAVSKCECFCIQFCYVSSTLICPWMTGMNLLCSSTHLSVSFAVACLSILTSHVSCSMLVSPMFVDISSINTCTKWVAVATMASELLIVGIVMYLCLKNMVCG